MGILCTALTTFRLQLFQGRGTQVVRERSAKPLCVSSILTRASKRISHPILSLDPTIPGHRELSKTVEVSPKVLKRWEAVRSEFGAEVPGNESRTGKVFRREPALFR